LHLRRTAWRGILWISALTGDHASSNQS
jgi:hypothetical protein